MANAITFNLIYIPIATCVVRSLSGFSVKFATKFSVVRSYTKHQGRALARDRYGNGCKSHQEPSSRVKLNYKDVPG